MSTNIEILITGLGLVSAIVGMGTALSTTYIVKRNQERKESDSRKQIKEIAKNIPIILGS